MSGFHDVRLPLAFSLGATGGVTWRTDVVELASGREFRNSRLSASRRRWDVGGAVQSLDDLQALTAFFEARRGRLHGFRFRDATDFSSNGADGEPSATDQAIGVGDGARTAFQLVKRYESGGETFARRITRPVAESVSVALDGDDATGGWAADTDTGVVTFATAPEEGTSVTAGYYFDVPARFDSDVLSISLDAFRAGRVVSAPLVELAE